MPSNRTIARFNHVVDLPISFYPSRIKVKSQRSMDQEIKASKGEYKKLSFLETPMLDAAFDFREVTHKTNESGMTDLIEKLDGTPIFCRLSRLIIGYLLKIFCYDSDSMFTEANYVSGNAFHIVDQVRQKMGGERFYQIPSEITDTFTKLLELQFHGIYWILEPYKIAKRVPGSITLVPNDQPQ